VTFELNHVFLVMTIRINFESSHIMCWLCFEGYSRSIMIDRLKDVFYRFFYFR